MPEHTTAPSFPPRTTRRTPPEVQEEDREGDVPEKPTQAEMEELLRNAGKDESTIRATIEAMLEAGLLLVLGTDINAQPDVSNTGSISVPNIFGPTNPNPDESRISDYTGPEITVTARAPDPGENADSQPNTGEEEDIDNKKTPELSEEEKEKQVQDLKQLCDIMFGENHDGGGWFSITQIQELFRNGLNHILLTTVFGTEAERFKDFLDEVFPDTNPWERLAGNTGVGSVAGQDVNERMQIRQLAVQKQMKRLEVSAQIQQAYIRNIPQMQLVPSQILHNQAEADLSNQRGLTEEQYTAIQTANAIMAPAQARANVERTENGHYQGSRQILKDSIEYIDTNAKAIGQGAGQIVLNMGKLAADVAKSVGSTTWDMMTESEQAKVVEAFKNYTLDYLKYGIFSSQPDPENKLNNQTDLQLLDIQPTY